jgi:hypothetical protein
LLVALWKLGAGTELMPTSHGVLDRALDSIKSRLPPELAVLTFSTTSVGLRCYELPDILLAAQEAMLTSEPNPTYLSTVINLREEEAAEIVVMHGLKVAQARELGIELRDQVNALKIDGWQPTVAA